MSEAISMLAQEKGLSEDALLHVLVDACIELQQMIDKPDTFELRVAGWLGKQHEPYARQQFAKLEAAGVPCQWCRDQEELRTALAARIGGASTGAMLL